MITTPLRATIQVLVAIPQTTATVPSTPGGLTEEQNAGMRAVIALAILAACLRVSGRSERRTGNGLPTPSRPLEWGTINFLATSDTHGKPSIAHVSTIATAYCSRLAARTSAREPLAVHTSQSAGVDGGKG